MANLKFIAYIILHCLHLQLYNIPIFSFSISELSNTWNLVLVFKILCQNSSTLLNLPNQFYVYAILSLNLFIFLSSHGFIGQMLGMVSLKAREKRANTFRI